MISLSFAFASLAILLVSAHFFPSLFLALAWFESLYRKLFSGANGIGLFCACALIMDLIAISSFLLRDLLSMYLGVMASLCHLSLCRCKHYFETFLASLFRPAKLFLRNRVVLLIANLLYKLSHRPKTFLHTHASNHSDSLQYNNFRFPN